MSNVSEEREQCIYIMYIYVTVYIPIDMLVTVYDPMLKLIVLVHRVKSIYRTLFKVCLFCNVWMGFPIIYSAITVHTYMLPNRAAHSLIPSLTIAKGSMVTVRFVHVAS